MVQIKPKTAGFKRYFNDGTLIHTVWPMKKLGIVIGFCYENPRLSIFPNGKPKLRLVYKKESI